MNTKDVLVYLVKNLQDLSEGRKKLMKLMFLVEHFNPETGGLRPRPRLGNRFFIYYYGVFSFDVMLEYGKLVREGVIEDGYPVRLLKDIPVKSDESMLSLINRILSKYGRCSGYELELETLKLLGIEPHEKDAYFGRSVTSIIQAMKSRHSR